MRKEDLIKAVGDITDRYIEEAAEPQKYRRNHQVRVILSVAACLAVLLLSAGVMRDMGMPIFQGATESAAEEEKENSEENDDECAPMETEPETGDADVLPPREILFIVNEVRGGKILAQLVKTGAEVPLKAGMTVEVVVEDSQLDESASAPEQEDLPTDILLQGTVDSVEEKDGRVVVYCSELRD